MSASQPLDATECGAVKKSNAASAIQSEKVTMSKTDLEAKLNRLSHFTNPPSDVVGEALAAYATRVQDLEAEITRLNDRVGEEVSFQTFIRKSEQEVRNDLARRHQDEKRALIAEIGFAAIIRDRVLNAKWQGRKTVKVEALLEGRPADEPQ